MANPVGTGPYLLKEWRRGQKVVLEASPSFREEYFPDSSDPADRAILAVMKGKGVPAIGRVEISIIEAGTGFDAPQVIPFPPRAASLRCAVSRR